MNNFNTSSNVYLTGTILHDFTPDFTDNFGNTYSRSLIAISRTSGVQDLIPLVYKEPIAFNNGNDCVSVHGIIQTRNGHGHLDVFVRAFSIIASDESDENTVSITGFICKPVIYRETPLGRLIADMLLVVNDTINRRSFYIPCIAWGRTAKLASTLQVGTLISAKGRIQSRQYSKLLPEGTVERMVYEVSLASISV